MQAFPRTNAAGDSLIGLPNDSRLPATMTVDLLLRRPLRFGGTRGGVYLDVRNLLNRRNIVAVRKDTGEPGPNTAGVQALAEAACQAHPEEIRSSQFGTTPLPTPMVTATSRAATSCSRSTWPPRRTLLSYFLRMARLVWCGWEWSSSSERGLPSAAPC